MKINIVDGFLALGFSFFIIVTGSFVVPFVDEQNSLVGILYALSIICGAVYILLKELFTREVKQND